MFIIARQIPNVTKNDKNNQKKNANMDESSFGGRIGETTNLIMREYALKYLMSDLMRENHLNNEVYVHDLDYYAVGCHNCLSIPFDDLLANGFNTRQTDVRPANSINTAFQLVAVIFQLESLQQFGGVSASHLDWTMVPYVRKSFAKHYLEGSYYLECSSEFLEEVSEKNLSEFSIEDDFYKQYPCIYQYAIDMTVKELNQAVEGMYHNLNTLQSRSGNQLPFTSINYGTCTLPEGRMVIKALLEGSINGIGTAIEKSKNYEEYEKILTPVLLIDPDTFDDITKAVIFIFDILFFNGYHTLLYLLRHFGY